MICLYLQEELIFFQETLWFIKDFQAKSIHAKSLLGGKHVIFYTGELSEILSCLFKMGQEKEQI